MTGTMGCVKSKWQLRGGAQSTQEVWKGLSGRRRWRITAVMSRTAGLKPTVWLRRALGLMPEWWVRQGRGDPGGWQRGLRHPGPVQGLELRPWDAEGDS